MQAAAALAQLVVAQVVHVMAQVVSEAVRVLSQLLEQPEFEHPAAHLPYSLWAVAAHDVAVAAQAARPAHPLLADVVWVEVVESVDVVEPLLDEEAPAVPVGYLRRRPPPA